MIAPKLICKRFLICCFFVILAVAGTFGQASVPVNLNTGTANVSIPLYTLQENDISVPIGIYYNTTGITVDQLTNYNSASNYFLDLGWNLQAAGQVTRVVRDLPDDYNSGDLVNPLLGWTQKAVPSFSIVNSTCTDESTNFYNLTSPSWYGYNVDTEPDVFSFNCGGVSGQFILSGGVQTIPYQDIKITYVTGAKAQIVSFTISTNQGYIYKFSQITQSTTITTVPSGSAFFRSRQYYQAQTPLTYTTAWGLTEIDSPAGSKVTFTYSTTGIPSASVDQHSIKYKTSNPVSGKIDDQYPTQAGYSFTVNSTTYPLSGIQSSTKQVNFGYSNIAIYNKTTGGTLELIRTVQISPAELRIVPGTDCSSNPTLSYHFDYYGGLSPLVLPFETKDKDFWGYFNNHNNASLLPKTFVYYNLTGADRYRLDSIPTNSQYYVLAGADRTVNPDVVMLGSLKQVMYPAGNIVRFEYESNQYFDQTANANYNGGGIRVKKITYSEGSGNSPDIVKTYTYAPNSGRLIYKPVFSYPIAFNQDFYGGSSTVMVPSQKTGSDHYDYFTVRSETDLSPQEEYNGNYVYYLSATEQEAGKGSIENDFLVPADYGKTVDGTDWQASYSYIARSPTCFDVGAITQDYYTYPYPPNTNYSFERGLLSTAKYFNEAGQLLKQQDYTYQRVGSPVYVTGLRTQEFTNSANSNAYIAFSPYKIIANVTKLQSTVHEVTYDPTNLANGLSTTSTAYYDSPYHKLLSRSTILLSDGTIYTIKNKYPQDYQITGTPADDNTSIIKSFQSQLNPPYLVNYMTGVPVEKTSSIQKPGLSDMVTGSSLTKFKNFTVYAPDKTIAPLVVPLPYQQLSLAISAPISDFAPSSISGGTTFTADSRYRNMLTMEDYDMKGNVTSVSNNQRVRNGAHYDVTETMPVLRVANASARQVAYSNFESIATNSFVYSDGSIPVPVSPGRTGDNSLNLAASTVLKQTVDKGPGQNYIFSCWIKTTSSTGTFSVTVTDGTTNTTFPAVTYTSNNNAWTYYQTVVPITAFTGASLTVSVTTSTAVSIDDIIFFPANSTVSTFTYNKFGKTSETNVNGITTFYQYDTRGALRYILDADQNILQRNVYNYKTSVSLAVQPTITDQTVNGAMDYQAGHVLAFNTSDPNQFSCLTGTFTYQWIFGDGASTTASSSPAATHTYANSGIYSYSVIVTSSVYGAQTTTKTVLIYQGDYSASICISSGPLVSYLCPSIAGFQWDNCNSSHTGTTPGTNSFTVTVLNPYNTTACPVTYTYTWSTAPLGTTNWTVKPQYTTSTSNTTTTVTMSVPNPSAPQISDSYSVKCDVTAQCLCPVAALLVPLASPVSPNTTIVFLQRSPTNNPPCNQ